MADRIRQTAKKLLREEKKSAKTETRPKQQTKKSSKRTSPAASKPTRSVQLNGPPVINSLPKLKPRITMRSGPMHNSVKVSIADYLGPLKVPDNGGAVAPDRGELIFDTMFSPARLEGSKITTISSMYERYVVNNLRFHYFSATPTTVGGALVMAFDKDPSDSTFNGEAGIRHALGLSSMTQFAPWEHASLAVERENQQTFYFTLPVTTGEEPERLEYTGALFVTVTTAGSLETNMALGDIWFEADVTFYDPTWEPTDVAAVLTSQDNSVRSISLEEYSGFYGTQENAQLVESNIRFIPNGTTVGMSADDVGFIIPSSNSTTYHLVDTMIGLSTTARITDQTLICIPLFGGKVHLDQYDTLNYAPNFATSDTSATQTNWSADFSFSLPNVIPQPSHFTSVQAYYVVSNLVGTVGGTSAQRTIMINREAGFYGDFGASRRHRKIDLPPKKAPGIVSEVPRRLRGTHSAVTPCLARKNKTIACSCKKCRTARQEGKQEEVEEPPRLIRRSGATD